MATEKRKFDRDEPIDGSEALPDALNRNTFAKHLAEIIHIKPTDECFTASLEGPWGYGKTSVIEMVKRHLQEADEPPIIITFNPWLVSDEESLIQKFLVQFAAQLKIPNRPKQSLKAAKELLSYSRLFDVARLIPGAEPWATTIKSVIEAVGNASEKIGELKELDLEGRKNQVKKVIAKLRKSIVVIIDDIDRLSPDEAFKVIKISKAIADFKGTSFLLAFDHDYLADALKRYGIKNANHYVEKIVQLRIPLPLIAIEDIHRLNNRLLKELSGIDLTSKFEDDSDRFGHVYHSHVKFLYKTPRQVKRVFNHLRFVLAQTEGEVCFTDLYLLSVLAIKAPAVYDDIKNNPARYVGKHLERDFFHERQKEKPEEVREKIGKLLNNQGDFEIGHIVGLVGEIFPLVSERSYSTFTTDYDKVGRVAAGERLYTALHYQVPKSILSEVDFLDYIGEKVDKKAFLGRVISEGHIERFFDLIQIHVDKIFRNESEILTSIYDEFLWSDAVRKEEEGEYSFGYTSTIKRIVWVTKEIVNSSNDKYTLISAIIENSDYLVISTEIIKEIMKQHGEIEDKEKGSSNNYWLDKATLDDMKKTWIDVAVTDLREGGILNSVHSCYIYWLMKKTFIEDLKKLFEEWLDGDNGIKKIALLIGRYGRDSTKGPYSQVNLDEMKSFIDVEKVQQLAKKELNKCPEIDPYFKAVYSSLVTGGAFYLVDGSKAMKE